MRTFDPSDNPPASGLIDRLIRRFPAASHAVAGSLLYAVVIVALGMALLPALVIASLTVPALIAQHAWWQWPLLAVLASALLFLCGFALLVVVPVFNALLPTRLRPFSGGYFTGASLPWYLHNGLFYLVRYSFLPFVTTTPIGIWFLRAMGMRIGRGTHITTENFSDVCMITVGSDVAIGGSANIFCHYGGGGRLVIAPVIIENRATIGEKATIMGDVVVGEGATILAHAALLPGTRVGAGERWGGAPARRISPAEWNVVKAEMRGLTPGDPPVPPAGQSRMT